MQRGNAFVMFTVGLLFLAFLAAALPGVIQLANNIQLNVGVYDNLTQVIVMLALGIFVIAAIIHVALSAKVF